MSSAGLLALRATARTEGSSDAAENSKVTQMFGHGKGIDLGAFIEPIIMYYQVSTVNALPSAGLDGRPNTEFETKSASTCTNSINTSCVDCHDVI